MTTEMLYMDHGLGGDPEVLKSARGPVPQVKEGEVLIKVHFAGVNRPDVSQRLGKYPPPDRKSTRLNSSHRSLSRMPSSA